jgi:phage repressor protein C with HTH and peptisase S24 domain
MDAVREALLPWQRVRVSGPSMAPTLHDGDTVLVRHGAAIRSGDLVLGRFRALPGRAVVKRAHHAIDGGWWLTSDNEYAGGDSEVHGVADVQARVVLVVHRAGVAGARALLPRRVRE